MACADITEATLVAVAPEFVGIDAARLTLLNGNARCFVGKKIEDTGKCDIAMAWMVAHLAKIGDNKGGAGPETSQKVGDLARSFATSAALSNFLEQTSYGLEYKRLIRQALCPISIRFVGC